MILIENEKRELINTLRYKGISDENVLKAIYNVPREKFIPKPFRKYAYDDNALPIECKQTISQPYTVAYMTQILEVKPGDKILEIGTGSGYQAAILCNLGAEVYTVERIKKLYEDSKNLLEHLHYKVHFKLNDGSLGWEKNSPYDKIIVTAAAPEIPPSLLNQLKINSKLIIPVGSKETQSIYEITKHASGFDKKIHNHFKFVPLVGMEGWKT